MSEIPEKVLAAIKKEASDGRLTCGRAHQLAEELDVELKVIGQAADELKIKIKACQLGCF